MVAERLGGSTLSPPLVFGLVVGVMIYSLGHLSGAHFNPAVTLAFASIGKFPRNQIFPYWFSQFVGALIALCLLSVLLPAGKGYGATFPSVNPWQALAWECILSFILMLVITSVATDSRAVGPMAGAAIGATVTLCALFGGPVTGASMNPARSLAPAIFEGHISILWLYFAGPFAGASLAAFFYEKIRCETETPKQVKGCC